MMNFKVLKSRYIGYKNLQQKKHVIDVHEETKPFKSDVCLSTFYQKVH